MRTSEVLNLTADILERDGWMQDDGWWPAYEGAPVCLEGGMVAALGFGPGARPVLRQCEAYAAVKSYLDLDNLGLPCLCGDKTCTVDIPQELYVWNDMPGRTQAEVIGVLRATALIEAAKENAADLVAVG